jgi:hypothetical protein
MSRAPRLLTALLVAAALSTPAAFPREAPRRESAGEPRATPLAALRNLVPDLWGALMHLWGEEGCSADPYGGRCSSIPATPVRPTPTLDSGCSMDPYGNCVY